MTDDYQPIETPSLKRVMGSCTMTIDLLRDGPVLRAWIEDEMLSQCPGIDMAYVAKTERPSTPGQATITWSWDYYVPVVDVSGGWSYRP